MAYFNFYIIDVYYNKNNWKVKLFDMIDKLLLITIPSKQYINIDSKYFE